MGEVYSIRGAHEFELATTSSPTILDAKLAIIWVSLFAASESTGVLYVIDNDHPGTNARTMLKKSFTLFGRTFFEAVPQFNFKRLARAALHWTCQIMRCLR
ncbi:hypothetical protein ARMGADRAFT_1087673 [Armillaria gallica]|uniref:Uncharacterized protein n=1 Tax=Armillaria gallica TaxID=47427 RepID=A0A2H3D819_ARMGA|nr:hypothetical protein ARMGADRAFT_1087673 [Armillaria gallica]